MEIIRVKPGILRVTEVCFLAMEGVKRFYDSYNAEVFVPPVTVISDNGNNLLVDGHHRSYAAFLAKVDEFDAELLQTDEDVLRCNEGRARSFKTLKELIENCVKGHQASENTFNLYSICDYALLQPMPQDWNSA